MASHWKLSRLERRGLLQKLFSVSGLAGKEIPCLALSGSFCTWAFTSLVNAQPEFAIATASHSVSINAEASCIVQAEELQIAASRPLWMITHALLDLVKILSNLAMRARMGRHCSGEEPASDAFPFDKLLA